MVVEWILLCFVYSFCGIRFFFVGFYWVIIIIMVGSFLKEGFKVVCLVFVFSLGLERVLEKGYLELRC